MASSSADCVFGVVRLISSASRTLVKTGPRLNSNRCSTVEYIEMPRTSHGKHVAGELDALEVYVEGAGHGLGERGLAHAGNAFDEKVSAGEKADQREPDNVILAANNGAKRFLQLVAAVGPGMAV